MSKNTLRIITVILSVIIFASFALSLASLSVSGTLRDPANVSVRIADREYLELVYGKVNRALDRSLSLTSLTRDDLSDIFTKEHVSNEAIRSLRCEIADLSGREIQAYSYENDELYERISERLTERSKETGVKFGGDGSPVYDLVTGAVTEALRVIPDGPRSAVGWFAARAEDIISFAPVCLAITAICTAALLVLTRKHMREALLKTALPLYLGSFAVFCAARYFLYRNYIAKTAVGDALMKHALLTAQNTFFSDMSSVALVPAVLFLLIGLVAAAVLAVHRADKRPSRHRHKHKEKTE